MQISFFKKIYKSENVGFLEAITVKSELLLGGFNVNQILKPLCIDIMNLNKRYIAYLVTYGVRFRTII
jgi:hypothetical protein